MINSTATVVDASKCKMYMKNYGEFYNNQIESAGTIILSRTQNVSEEKLAKVLAMIKEKNDEDQHFLYSMLNIFVIADTLEELKRDVVADAVGYAGHLTQGA